MNDFDSSELDGRLLRTFLVVLEESSVSRAADRIGVTQSAVSHALGRLRRILGDPLFVRSGQGLTPTERARALRGPVQAVLDGMRALTDDRPFDPQSEAMHFRIAANDLQRDLIFPQLLRDARADGIRLSLDFSLSGVPDAALLRNDRCDLMLTPLPPDAPDILQKRLLDSHMKVFYDASTRQAPDSWDSVCQSDRIEVRFADGRSAHAVLRGVDLSQLPAPLITLPHFNAIPPMILDSDLISIDIALMKLGPLQRLDCAPLPLPCAPVSIYMVWHERWRTDPAHRWLRDRVARIASDLARRTKG